MEAPNSYASLQHHNENGFKKKKRKEPSASAFPFLPSAAFLSSPLLFLSQLPLSTFLSERRRVDDKASTEQPLLICSSSGDGDEHPAAMRRSSASAVPTITFEEALRREMEYRKTLERTHPHLLIALNADPDLRKEVSTDSISDAFKRKLAPESTVPQQQSSFSCSGVQRQPANWYPFKKKVKVLHPPSQILQCPRPNVVPSFWCKICKVDCVTEFNFGAHIGGKKHKAKKLEILGNRNNGRTGSQCSGNRNPEQNSHVVSGTRNSEPNVSSGIVSSSCDLSSESRINGSEESGCTAPPMSSLDFTAI